MLRDHVKDGLVDYDGLKADAGNLQRYGAVLSATGPTQTPKQFENVASRTAYWINAYNACVLLAAVKAYPTTTLYDLSMPRIEEDISFLVDGSSHRLVDIERKALEEAQGDVRVIFALSRGAIGTPRLRDEPYRAASLDAQLTDAVARSLSNPSLLYVDDDSRSILVWQDILSRQDDIIRYWQEQRRSRHAYLYNVLVELASREGRVRLQNAAGYTIREIPFNRALNRWSPRHQWPVIH